MIPLLIGAALVIGVLAMKGSSSGDGGIARCGDAMSAKDADIFDKAMALPHAGGTADAAKMKLVIAAYDAGGFHGAANCLRTRHGL